MGARRRRSALPLAPILAVILLVAFVRPAAAAAGDDRIVFRNSTDSPTVSGADGAELAGAVYVSLSVADPEDVQEVRYLLQDGRDTYASTAVTTSPFEVGFDASRIPVGRPQLVAELTTSTGTRTLDASVAIGRGAGSTSTTTATPGTATSDAPAESTGDEPQGYPDRVAALYYMLWPDSGSPPTSELPADVNVVDLAFAQGSPPSLVGWSPQGEQALVGELRALRSRGVRVVLSIGGQGGVVDTSDHDGFVRGVLAINERIPLDGIDWDIEGAAVDTDDIVAISTALKEARGQRFAVTLAPNGGNIGQYLPVAAALHRVGALDMIGQQFYDAPVTVDAARGRIRQAIAAGIPEERIGVGMMIGEGENYWTVDEAATNVEALRSAHPGLRGGYLWEAGRPGTDEWASRVGAMMRGPSRP